MLQARLPQTAARAGARPAAPALPGAGAAAARCGCSVGAARPAGRQQARVVCQAAAAVEEAAPAAAPARPSLHSMAPPETYAIVEVGGKQMFVEPGKWYTCNRLQVAVGDKIRLGRVLALKQGDSFTVGKPYLEGVTVEAEVLEELRGPKIIVYKMKPKKHYRRKNGHRQELTNRSPTGGESMGRARGPAAVLPASPAYSFSRSPTGAASPPPRGGSPGPGDSGKLDASSTHESSRGTGFGTSGRLARYGNDNPGPGEYNADSSITHRRVLAASLTGRGSHDPLKPQSPAPGQYKQVAAELTHPAAPAASVGQRHAPPASHARSPAVGAYSPESFSSKSPLPVTIKHRRGLAASDRPDSGHSVPGPGAYRPQDVTLARRTAPAHTLAQRLDSRGLVVRPPSPGPGAYDVHGSTLGVAGQP
ncbi:rplU [Scenedesmus sp. PABB004]|nr:rplU [Scenedesmus sp. PABB004]